MNRLIPLLLILLAPVAKALSPPSPPPPPPPPPQVWIDPASGLQAIKLADVDIQIRTHGFIARTTLDLRFDNPNARVLEGEFVFPLAAGQTVAGYALEALVNAAKLDGRVNDEEKRAITIASPRVPSSNGALPIGPSLARNGQTMAAGAPDVAR